MLGISEESKGIVPMTEASEPKPLPTQEEMFDWLRTVQDPELFMSIVDLGLIYEAKLGDDARLDVRMTLTSPGCPAGDYLVQAVKDRGLQHEAVKTCEVQIVWEPKWDPATMASEEAKDSLGIW